MNTRWILEEKNLGVDFGYDYKGQQEIGISGICSAFGIEQFPETTGEGQMTKLPRDLVLREQTIRGKEYVMIHFVEGTKDKSISECGRFNRDESVHTDWSSDYFIIIAEMHEKAKMIELWNAFQEKKVVFNYDFHTSRCQQSIRLTIAN